MYFVVLLFSSVLGLVSGQQVQLTRSNPNVMGTNDLVLTCSLSGSSGLKTDGLINMQLSKNTSSGNSNNIVSIFSSSDDYIWQDTSMEIRDGVSVAGLNTKGNIQTATLTLTIDRYSTTCQDAGVYFCVVSAFTTDNILFVGTGTATVEITSISASAALSVSPFSSSGLSLYQYQVGTTLNFTCTSKVGTNQVNHRWCYKRPSDTSLTQPSTNTGIIQNTEGLVQVDGCNWRRTSYFEYNVSSADTTTVILCEPDRPGSAYSLCNSTGFANSITIIKNVPTVVSFVPSASSYRLTEGQSLPTITCTANCIPECTYYWYKDGHPYLTGTDLRFTDVQRKAEGVYRCIASNAYGNYTSNSVTVTVIYVPTVSFVPSASSYRLTEGQSVPTITCAANCIPECTYYWYKDGHPYLTGTDLRLTDVQQNAEGLYRCIASNAYGNYTSNSVTVIVKCPSVTVCDPSIQTTGVALICTSVVVLLITLAALVVMTRKHQLLCVRCRNQKESVTTTQGDIARTYDHLYMDRIEKPSVYSQLDQGKDNTLGESHKYENYSGSTHEYEIPAEANKR